MLWLGPEGEGPAGAWEIEPQIDRLGHSRKRSPRLSPVGRHRSGNRGPAPKRLIGTARDLLPRPGQPALNERQGRLLARGARPCSKPPRPCAIRCW